MIIKKKAAEKFFSFEALLLLYHGLTLSTINLGIISRQQFLIPLTLKKEKKRPPSIGSLFQY